MTPPQSSDCDKTPGQPERLHIQLCHYKQKYNWDCGVSSVLMVLPRRDRASLLNNFAYVCKQEGFNKSTWTIDLCYLLKRYGIKHEFYTITWGAHPGYRANSFYNRVMLKDESRVNKRFEQARDVGLTIKIRTLTVESLLEHLTNGPAIVLTNARLLTCDICKLNKVSSELRKCIPWPSSYQGHYVVLCGYDFNTKKILYRNPSLSDRVCVMTLETLEEARRDYGTDEDTILVYS